VSDPLPLRLRGEITDKTLKMILGILPRQIKHKQQSPGQSPGIWTREDGTGQRHLKIELRVSL